MSGEISVSGHRHRSPPCQLELIGTQNFYWKFLPDCWARLSGNLKHLFCVLSCAVLCLEIGKFSSCYLVLLWSRVESRPDNIKLLLEKFSTRVLIVTKLQVTQNFPNTESKYFRLWGGYFACLFVLITTTTYQSFNIIFNKFSFAADQSQDIFISAISKLITNWKYFNILHYKEHEDGRWCWLL